MIIEIKDAPSVKHITIDIDFGDDGVAKITKTLDAPETLNYTNETNETTQSRKYSTFDKPLDLDEDFSQSVAEVIEKPTIDIGEREVKVSEDMAGLEI